MQTIIKSYDDFPAVLSASDLRQILPLSRAGIYNLINSDGFPVIRVGKRALIPKEGFIRWLEQSTIKAV